MKEFSLIILVALSGCSNFPIIENVVEDVIELKNLEKMHEIHHNLDHKIVNV